MYVTRIKYAKKYLKYSKYAIPEENHDIWVTDSPNHLQATPIKVIENI